MSDLTIEASEPDRSPDLSTRSAASDEGGAGVRRPPAPGGDLGDALRSAYQQTVQEEVPDEMLNLLGRLS